MLRDYDFEIVGVSQPGKVTVLSGGEEAAFTRSYDDIRKTLTVSVAAIPARLELTVLLDGVRLDVYETSPISRLHRLMRYFRLSTLAKSLFMQKLPFLLTNPAAIFEISNHFTKPQLLAIYETIFQASETKPMNDVISAFETMMGNMRKLMQ